MSVKSSSERSRVKAWKSGKEGEFAREIFWTEIARLKDDHDADEELEQPQRRGQIAEYAGQEMLSRRPMQAAGEKHARMLQIALAPASVADRQVDERGRAFLVGAAERRHHVDRIAGAADERRLDEVMAHDMPAPRRAAAQVRQAAMAREGFRADDGVVAPVIAVAAHPAGEAHRNDRAIDAGGELLNPREQRVAVDDQRQGLDDPAVGVGLHRGGELHDRRAGHQAVGVEHDHMRIGAAPARNEILDIAGLAARVLLAAPDRRGGRAASKAAPNGDEGALLRDPDVRIGRVGEEEPVEMLAKPGRLHVLVDGLQRREDAARRLIVDRHDDGGLLRQDVRQRRGRGASTGARRSRRRSSQNSARSRKN